MKVPVKIHPIVYEFVVETTGSDTIRPKKNNELWKLVRKNLDLPPDNFVVTNQGEFIYIELLDCHSTKAHNVHTNAPTYINTLYRWHLNPTAQNEISSTLRTNFKNHFHSFMFGILSMNPSMEIKLAIEKFCDVYNLTLNKVSYEMLKKSWYRCELRKRLLGMSEKSCPILV